MKTYNKGDIIATQQEFLHGNEKLYFIAAGSAIKVHDGVAGRKRLEKRYAGTVIGEMSFFLETPRHDSIIADDDDTIMFEYSHKQYNTMKAEYPLMGEDLLKHVMTKLGDTIKRLVNENHMLNILDGEEEDDVFDEDEDEGIDSTMAARNAKVRSANERILMDGQRANEVEDPQNGLTRMETAEEVEKRHHSGFGIMADEANVSPCAG